MILNFEGHSNLDDQSHNYIMGIGMVHRRSTFNLTSIYPNLSSKLRGREGKIEAFFLGFVSSYELKEPFGSKKEKESRGITVSEMLTIKNCCKVEIPDTGRI